MNRVRICARSDSFEITEERSRNLGFQPDRWGAGWEACSFATGQDDRSTEQAGCLSYVPRRLKEMKSLRVLRDLRD